MNMHILAETSQYALLAMGVVSIATPWAFSAYGKWRRLQRMQRAIKHRMLAEFDAGTGALDDLKQTILRQLDESEARTARALMQVEEIGRTLRATSIAVISLDAQQRILRLNPAAARFLATDEAHACGRLLQEIVREPALNAFVDEALAVSAPASGQLALRAHEGTHGGMTVAASSEPLELLDGRSGIVLSLVDITRARRLEAMRSEFAANVSHELRTPITTIRGFVDTLGQLGRTDLDRSERYLAIVQRNVARLSAIVEDILTLSLLEDPTRPQVLERKRVAVAGLLQECADNLAHDAELRKVHLVIDGDREACAVVNPSLAIQAITNLLSNAIRHAKEHSTVTMRVIVSENECAIEVIDRGEGIPSRHLERIFERFYRVDKSRHRETGGTGLGLAIVKHIAQVHGGRVEAQSQVGEGSCFRIWFPAQFPTNQRDLNEI